MVKHVFIKISGNVQGVWFRQSAKDEADKLGLTGTVYNSPGGTVEIHAEGEEAKLVQLEKWCRDGPQLASVAKITSQELPLQDYKDFRII